MEELLISSVVKGFIFSVHGELGPQPIYMFPNYVSDNDLGKVKKLNEEKNQLTLSYRDVTQISIKNLSIFISDREFSQNSEFDSLKYFAILPYPDFKATSLTFFHYISTNLSESPVATAFSILVDEYSRSFLYNNINRIKPIVIEFFNSFDKELLDSYPTQEYVERFFVNLFKGIIEIEKNPSTPVSSHRKLKILMAGLDDTGKTSFLLSVDRKYSKTYFRC